jgi:hypothetical protein
MARFDAAKREADWFDTEIRRAPAFDAVGAIAFGLWTHLPFLVDGDHTLPELAVIVMDTEVSEVELSRFLSDLMAASFLEWLMPVGRYRMSALSQRYYSLSEPEGEGVER